MDTLKKQREQLAKAILELHELYISKGEADKPMTISLPDISRMADLPQEFAENILIEFIGEKVINIQKSVITITDKKTLNKIAG
jgi:hypothetical protein